MSTQRKVPLWKYGAKLGAPKGFGRLIAFCEALDQGVSPSPAVMEELRAAFEDILKGVDPAIALCLKKPTRRKRNLMESKRPLEIARAVEDFLRLGKKVKQAESLVAEKYGVSIPTVQKYRKDMNAILLALDSMHISIRGM